MNERVKYKYAKIAIASTPIGRVLKKLRIHYKAEKEPAHLVVPYVLTCAAYLEAKLNESLFQFGMKRYGEDIADAFMSLNLPIKLKVLVPLLTDGRYKIKQDHFVYQRLATLIRVRNVVTHAKPEVKEVPAEDVMQDPFMLMGMGGGKPEEVIERLQRQFSGPDITLGASKAVTPLEYHEALEKLEKWFFQRCPDKLKKVAMVIDRSKEAQWKEHHSTMIKYLDD